MNARHFGLIFSAIAVAVLILFSVTACDNQQGTGSSVLAKPVTTEKTETTPGAIPFPSTTENDPNLAQGQTKIKQAGIDGLKQVKVKVTYVDGKETKRELLPDVVTLQPVPQITVVGTKPPEPEPPLDCDPNYSGACVPIASDVDCAGGSGNGPAYVAGPVTVIGSDIYDLDRDGDGVGCE